jgi:hypothetical protein
MVVEADFSLKLGYSKREVRMGSNRFSKVHRILKFLNLELNLGFGSSNLTATEPDFWSGSGPVQVRQRFRT